MKNIEQLSKDIWIANVNLGDFDVRGVLIAGDERIVVWDSLSHPDDMRFFRPMTHGRELVIVYSHADWDHIWGTAGLPYDRATIVGHTLCGERFLTEAPLTLAEKMGGDPAHWGAVKLVPPTLTFAKEYEVNLGRASLFLHHLPGHTPDSIAGFLPDQGILLPGDAVETPFPLVPAECNLTGWIEGLLRWQEDPRVRTVIPSHGAMGGREILLQNIVYLQHLLAGREMAEPGMLNEFYREAHRANVRAWCRGARE